MIHPLVHHDSFSFVPWLIPMCSFARSTHMTHPLVHHDAFSFVPWHIPMCSFAMCARSTNMMHLLWCIRLCTMTHPLVHHDSFPFVPWLSPVCAMTHAYVLSDNVCEIHTHDMTHSLVCHDSFTCAPWPIHFVCHDSFLCADSQCIQSPHTHTHSQITGQFCNILQHTHCNILQHTATHCNIRQIHTHALKAIHQGNNSNSATQYNTHTATHCNTLLQLDRLDRFAKIIKSLFSKFWKWEFENF